MTVSESTVFKVNIDETALQFMRDLVKSKSDVPDNIKKILVEKSASYDDIKMIHSFFKDDGLKLHELLSNSEIVLPEPVIEPRNPELEARIQKLKRLVEQQQYDKMTKNVRAKGRDPDDSIGAQLQFMNKQLVAVAQFVFSVGSGFMFGFYGVQLLVGDLDFGFRLLLGVICSLVIALAEIYFLAKIIAELDLEGTVKTEEPPQCDEALPQETPFTEKPHQD